VSRIPFTRAHLTGRELEYVARAVSENHLSGDGGFTKRCNAWLEERVGCAKALMTPSCTAALEMAAILADIGPGDEVIMPAFTFASTANAFVLRGGVPVFVDIDPVTFNLDHHLIEQAVTPRTRAIVPVHYAGVGCEMDAILDIAARHRLYVIEDAAQGILSSYRGRPLGSFGQLAALSFHETKNVVAGEGGALLINDPELIARAEIIREKGTNRTQFFRGQVDKYTWVDIGSSYLPSEIVSAFLLAQLENADAIQHDRLRIWNAYYDAFEPLEARGLLLRPTIPHDRSNNAHAFYVLVRDLPTRTHVIESLTRQHISAVFHYVPLDTSPAGRRYARAAGPLPVTHSISERIIRMPLWVGMTADEIGRVVAETAAALAAAPVNA
jgi:dTDP-4-amino-4,6-dideoxygalactose transaminase